MCRTPRSWPSASNAQRSGMIVLIAAPAPAITFTGRIAPEKRTAGKQSIGRASVACAGLLTAAEVRSPSVSAAAAVSVSEIPTVTYVVVRAAGMRSSTRRTASISTTTKIRNGSSTALSDQMLTAHDRPLGDDLKEPIGQAEEERPEGDPEEDHRDRARVRVADVERAGSEEDREHRDDQRRGADQDRHGQAVAHHRLERSSRQHRKLACEADAVAAVWRPRLRFDGAAVGTMRLEPLRPFSRRP